jgi:hypothetical protein
MFKGIGSTSAVAPPVRAREAKRNATEPVRRVRIVVAMGRQGSKRHSMVNSLFNMVFSG